MKKYVLSETLFISFILLIPSYVNYSYHFIQIPLSISDPKLTMLLPCAEPQEITYIILISRTAPLLLCIDNVAISCKGGFPVPHVHLPTIPHSVSRCMYGYLGRWHDSYRKLVELSNVI